MSEREFNANEAEPYNLEGWVKQGRVRLASLGRRVVDRVQESLEAVDDIRRPETAPRRFRRPPPEDDRRNFGMRFKRDNQIKELDIDPDKYYQAKRARVALETRVIDKPLALDGNRSS